jgi:quinol-cytochrome oxidoreductase complex cytochrome b subunit/Fe-S-cluster-containing hydrogenase component 2
MSKSKGNPQNMLPGVNPESDCQEAEDSVTGTVSRHLAANGGDEEQEHDLNWGDMQADGNKPAASIETWAPARAGWLRFLERIALAVERPANRLIGSVQLNPFYHTGTITVLLLGIVGLTGFYLFLFFKYGFDASYNDVVTRIEEPFIARTIRAIHRYASGALVITTLLHAYRTLFMERFRGPRWLAWVTGIMMTIFLWIAGVTGYWLIWDQRAQLINDSFVNFLQAVTPFAASYMVMLTRADISGLSWPLFLFVFAIHLLMFIITAVFFWLHIKRLNRPKWLPPAYWVVGVAVVVLLVGLLFPAGMLPQGDLERLPGPVTIDPLFLFFLPASGNALLSWTLWGGLLLLTILLTLLPWLRRRSKPAASDTEALSTTLPKVNIIKERCNGCTVCALDCPYNAIQMVERDDGRPHKYIAIEDPSLCVSCGICVGSCDAVAITMGEISPLMLWETVASHIESARTNGPADQLKVVFTCERHAAHGAKSYLAHTANLPEGMNLEVITLPCVGSAPPDLLARTLDAGVDEVQMVGCPPDDCTDREGNLWAEQRLVRERLPRLKRPYANAPITAYWLPPDDFSQAIEASSPPAASNGDGQPVDYLEQRRMFKEVSWRNYIMAFVLLAVVMVLQVLLTDLPITPFPDPPAMTQAIFSDLAEPIGRNSYISTALGSELTLTLEVDGQPIYSDMYETTGLLEARSTPFYFEHELEPGEHHLRLTLADDNSDITFVLFDEQVPLEVGQIFRYGQ